MDGLRKSLSGECSSIWLINLRGDIKNVMKGITASDSEKDNIFGNQCSLGIAIAFFVIKEKRDPAAKIYYHDLITSSSENKLAWVKKHKSINNIKFKAVALDNNNDWVNQKNKYYEKYISLDSKEQGMFNLKSLGSTTCRDKFHS